MQTLLSVPPSLDAFLRSQKGVATTPLARLAAFSGSDPAGVRLGSGGGTVGLLHSAWQQTQHKATVRLDKWIRGEQRLVLHAGGESRRLPAYAAIGKALLPVPSSSSSDATRFDQVLADFQLSTYRQVLHEAGDHCRMMVASGDVWLDFDPLEMPAILADIAGIGMRVAPEVAQYFGVFFVAKSDRASAGGREQSIAFFLQKPSPAEIYRHASRYDFYVDTGLWLFSAPAVEFLFRRCGWDERRQRFATPDRHPAHLDLYSEIGCAFGTETRAPAALRRLGWSGLTTSVVPLDQANFFHLGSSRQLFESFEHLVSAKLNRPKTFSFATPAGAIKQHSNLPVWLDGLAADTRWQLGGLNIVCGSTLGQGSLRLAQEQCIEIAPVGHDRYVVRPYLLDDKLRGQPGAGGMICGRDAAEWLERRQLKLKRDDVFNLPIYPVVAAGDIQQSLIDWFFAAEPAMDVTRQVHASERLSAAAIPNVINFGRYFADRAKGHAEVLIAQFTACAETGDLRVFAQDFSAVAQHAKQEQRLSIWLQRHWRRLLARLPRPEQQSRLLMLIAELSSKPAREKLTRQAHEVLQQGMISSERLAKSQPRLALKEDQIVWSRSPVRLDLAGGWTDTPPYCLEYGGSVVNLAVLLNGQPPIQVFVRPLTEPIISLRSIDLGSTEVITSYESLAAFRDARSGFSLPKAALALAGFHPDFSGGRPAATLKGRLKTFGGGLEISLLSAVPKGSGLGTSSILAATILGALNRACGLGWDEVSLYGRVLGVEQLLTTGGGWQDQAGALFRGIKLIETVPGPAQTPSVRYLPQHLFGPTHANQTLLLYYTGITRLAKGILKEIVHDMFLGRFSTLQTLGMIRANAAALFNAVQQSDPAALHRCIARSWELNQRLDAGTTTPAINAIIARCQPDSTAVKLLGAGGGGYMLICAKTSEAGQRIRSRLEAKPPNRRARFIDFQPAERGLEVTVS
jgi:galactokinase/mevalonate kinase-like predicted kinase